MYRCPASLLAIVALLILVRDAAADDYTDPSITQEEKAHWAYKVPVRPPIPAVRNTARIRTPIDAFILAKLEAVGIAPAPEADKLTLIRRVTLDLIGLPPTPQEIDDFLKDSRADAYEKLVDRLLASPHFGERWATHWLDVVRFAESNGFEVDGERPHAWRYRDYVIRSFNDDKPYDRFLTEQIAGDVLAAGKDPRDCADLWVATGMHRCGPVHMVGGNLDADVLRQEMLTEMVAGIGSGVLGLTVGCARCHDHKFDPISQGDYYRLQAFFEASRFTDVDLAIPEEKATRKKTSDALNAKLAPLKSQVSAIDTPYRTKLTKKKRDALEPKYQQALSVPAEKRTPEQKKLAADANTLVKVTWDEVLAAMTPADRGRRTELRERIHALESLTPLPTAAAWAIKDGDDSPKTFVLKRGNPKSKWTVVTANVPRVLVSAPIEPKNRIDLAKWITRPDHPLTARVIVNRLWQHHFGRGIVATPNDFGVRGEAPTHPELLDWLATELVKPAKPTDGHSWAWSVKPWSLKHIHRLMVLSSTYRQASSTTASALAKKADPDNTLLWRMNRRRLEAEAIRDSILTASEELNPELGGVSVKVPLEPEVYDLIFTEGEPDGLWHVTPDTAQHYRRSVYLFSKRNVRLPLFEAFDQPDTLNSCAARPVSTFAPQALILINGPFAQEQGKALATRLMREYGDDADRQINALYRRALGRFPTNAEKQLAVEFLGSQCATIRERLKARLPLGLDPLTLPAGVDPARVRALADLCVVLFNTNEFVYLP